MTKDIQPMWAVKIARRDTERIDTSKFKYALGSINAKFFKGRLVVLGAVRKDDYFFQTVQQLDKGDYPLNWTASADHAAGSARRLRPI